MSVFKPTEASLNQWRLQAADRIHSQLRTQSLKSKSNHNENEKSTNNKQQI
jgi:hypothetical protein